jgi:hypothetical protein
MIGAMFGRIGCEMTSHGRHGVVSLQVRPSSSDQ